MAGCPPVLLGFLLLLSYASCQYLVTIDHYDYAIYFDDNNFRKFHECLCGANTRGCNATSYTTENYRTFYDVTKIVRDNTTVPYVYYNSYKCASYRDVNTTLNVCTRILLDNPKEKPDPYIPCQNITVNKLLVSCSSGCFDILWMNSQNITSIDKDNELLGCSLCQTETSTTLMRTMTTTTKPTTTTTKPTTITTNFETTTTKRTMTTLKPMTTTTEPTKTTTNPTTTTTKTTTANFDSSDDNIPLIVGVVVAVIVVLVIICIIIVIWRRRRRNSKLPSTSHHYTASTGVMSQNYEDTDEMHGHVGLNGNGSSVPNTYVTTDDHSMQTQRPGLQNGQAVVDAYVSAEEVIQKKRAAAAKNNGRTNQGTEYAGVKQDVPDTVIYPDNGPYNINNKNNRSAPNPYSTPPASTTYSRLGEPVRNIQNPYDALQNPGEYSVAKSTPTNSNTTAEYSFAGTATSPSSTQDSQTVHNSTPPSQLTNRNAYDYEDVGANNMTTRPNVPVNHYEETPAQAYGVNKDGAQAPQEPDYTNFPVKESDPAKNDYAKLREPVRNIQNPYNTTSNQEDGLQESTSQAPPASADDPYSLARPT